MTKMTKPCKVCGKEFLYSTSFPTTCVNCCEAIKLGIKKTESKRAIPVEIIEEEIRTLTEQIKDLTHARNVLNRLLTLGQKHNKHLVNNPEPCRHDWSATGFCLECGIDKPKPEPEFVMTGTCSGKTGTAVIECPPHVWECESGVVSCSKCGSFQ